MSANKAHIRFRPPLCRQPVTWIAYEIMSDFPGRDRRWGLASVTTRFGHSQYNSLVQVNHSPWVPSLTAIMTWLPSYPTPLSIHLHASHPWRVSSAPSPCGKASTAPVNYAMRSYEAAAWHETLAGKQSHEWPGSGSPGACDWLQRQDQLVNDAKITVQEDGGCGTQDFRSHSQPNRYHFVGRYCFTPLHLAPCSCGLGT